MKDIHSECKINPSSAACNHWQREVCGRCARWKLDQDQAPAHKLITADECQRLRRELQTSLFSEHRGLNPMTYLLLLFFMIFCMVLILWLLAKAFVFKKPKPKFIHVCQDRQSGGRASVDDIMQKLREKCTASSQGMQSDELYVPPKFWTSFGMSGFGRKDRQIKQEPTPADTRIGIDNEMETDASEDTSDMESSESVTTEVLNESEDKVSDETSAEETTSSGSSKSEQTERSTSDEDQTSITMDIQQEARKFTDSIGKMPTSYGPTTANLSNSQSRSKIRWANWLRRSKQNDFQT